MRKRVVAAAVCALAANLMVTHQAGAVDGCALALCLVKGGSAYSECKPILKDAAKDAARGKPPPRCKKVGGGDNSGSAQNEEQYTQATNGAGAIQSGGAAANPYGDAVGDKYSAAQSTAIEQAATAGELVNAGVRTVGTSATDNTINADEAKSKAPGATAEAQAATAKGQAACVTVSCEIVAVVEPDPLEFINPEDGGLIAR
jgi:hypothetical protein